MVEDACRELITAYAPANPRTSLTNAATHLAGFCVWVAQQPGRPDPSAPLSIDELRAPGMADAYITAVTETVPDASRATKRTVIRRALLHLGGVPKAQKIAYQPLQAPYTLDEVARLVRLARNQPTPARRRALSAALALGLGAGLDSIDQRGITPGHVREVDLADFGPVVLVDVPGPRARTVVVAADYTDLLREALALHREAGRGDDAPLHGQKLTRKQVVKAVEQGVVTATGETVEVNGARLRATWLVAAMCADVPLATLLRAAGLKSARSLTDLLPYCPEADPAKVQAALAAVSSSAGEGA